MRVLIKRAWSVKREAWSVERKSVKREAWSVKCEAWSVERKSVKYDLRYTTHGIIQRLNTFQLIYYSKNSFIN